MSCVLPCVLFFAVIFISWMVSQLHVFWWPSACMQTTHTHRHIQATRTYVTEIQSMKYTSLQKTEHKEEEHQDTK
jgi:hypothetical protein